MRLLVCLGVLLGSFLIPQEVCAQIAGSASATSSYFAPDKILAFADHLRQRGDFNRSVSEYQRYLFSMVTANRPYAHYQLGTSLLELEKPYEASRHFLQAARTTEYSSFRDSSYVGYLGALLRAEMYGPFFDVVDTLHLDSSTFQTRLSQIAALAHLQRGEWKKARQTLQVTGQPDVAAHFASSASPIERLVNRSMQLPRKTPILAGVLSALVPGVGKMYAGRLEDGLYSLILIGGASWLAYDGFSEHGTSSVKGWLFGTAGAVLYAGNIYGSVVAVRLYNAGHEEAFQDDVRAQIRITTTL